MLKKFPNDYDKFIELKDYMNLINKYEVIK